MRTIQVLSHAPLPHAAVRAHRALRAGALALGLGGVAFGLMHDAVRTWSNLLVDGFFVLSIGLGGLVFIAIHHLSGAAWSAGMRRVAEAMTAALPIAALTLIALFFGRRSLFGWGAEAARAGHEAVTVHASAYFAVPFVFSRTVVCLALWLAFAALVRRASAREDASADPVHHKHSVRCSAAFIVVFAVSFSLATVDWILSLDPNWTTTMFPVYVFAGLLVEAVATIALAVVLLHERGHLRGLVTASHVHDLGKLMFAFTMFWAYIWFSQYLLIWYANLPEEIGYYHVRTNTAWQVPFLLNPAVNWLIPFVVLLPRAAKRHAATVKWIAIVLLLGRWLDVYLLVAPATIGTPAFGPIELSIALAYCGITWHAVSETLARRPLVVRHDPRLADCIRHSR